MTPLLTLQQVVRKASTHGQLRAWHQAAMRQRGIPVTDRAGLLVATVNHGRWVAVCPTCDTGIVLVPDNPGLCFGCGSIYCGAVFPTRAHRLAIEEALAQRPRHRNQNWTPGETVEQLLAENAEHM